MENSQSSLQGLFGPYLPISTHCDLLNVEVPDGMDWESSVALSNLKNAVGGNVTDWVAKKLNYTRAGICAALKAEQVDAVAGAIWNIEKKGQGIIIGDQTGIGKGRQAAAIIRYAVLQGKKAIFITQKPNLFTDIYRDLVDIGSGHLRPFIVNAKEAKTNILDKAGKIVYQAPEKSIQDAVFAGSDTALAHFDFVMATYSQFAKNGLDAKNQMMMDAKGKFLNGLSDGNILILDESHNAAGSSNTGAFFKTCVSKSAGTIFLSATFAKRPENMTIYSNKTCLSDANLSPEAFDLAFMRGGVALQEVVAAQLAQEGQMWRRQRNYENVIVNYITLTDKGPQHRAQADMVTELIREIIWFQEVFIDPIIGRLSAQMAAQQTEAAKTRGTDKAGLDNSPYFSRIFQVINQMLFSLKAEDVANHAVDLLKQDKKVVIAFSSTMGSFLDEFEMGEVIKADFSEVLKRGLRSTLSYSVKDSKGKSTKHYLPLSQLPPDAYEAYSALGIKIDKSVTGLNISPIDLVVDIITAAGYKVAEITGRSAMVQFKYTEEQEKAAKAKAEAKKKGKTAKYPTEGPLTHPDQIKPLARKLLHPHQVSALVSAETEEHWGIFDDLQATGELLLKRKFDRETAEYRKNHPADYRDYAEEIALPSLRFFGQTGTEWLIFEWDGEDRLFGYAILNGDLQNAEWGYVSLRELHGNYGFGRNVELDVFYTPEPIAKAMRKHDAYAEVEGLGHLNQLADKKVGMVAPRTKENVAEAFMKFQNNEIDVLLINQSGATGASAHAIPTEKVPKDQVKQRVMIVLQPELDINNEIQKRGRINRTGQILQPRYDYFSTTIPAEQRLMMMLQKKLKSLDANTSAKADSSKAILDVPDFLNKYGDKVVYQWLAENSQINAMIGDPLSIAPDSDDTDGKLKAEKSQDAAKKVTGRVAVLPAKEQDKFYSEVIEIYDKTILSLKQASRYDLEVETMPLDAVSIDRKVIVINPDPSKSVFSNHTYLEEFDCVNLRKPFLVEEVSAMIKAELSDSNGDIDVYRNTLTTNLDKWVEKKRATIITDTRAERDDKIARIPTEAKYIKLKTEEERQVYKVERAAELREWEEMKLEAENLKLTNQSGMIRKNMQFFYPGRSVYFPQLTIDDSAALVPGVFLGWDINEKRDNPYTPSAISLTFALASSLRRLDVSLSGDSGLQVNYCRNESYAIPSNKHLEEWTTIAKKGMVGRKRRFIVTGNVLQALARESYKNGQFISFSLQEGGTRKGYLLPDSYSPAGSGSEKGKELQIPVPVFMAKEYIFKEVGRRNIVQTDQAMAFDFHRGLFAITVPMSKTQGGKFYQDKVLMSLVDGNNFNKVGSMMLGLVSSKELVYNALEYLQSEFKMNVMVPESEMEELENYIPAGFEDAVIQEVKSEPIPIIDPADVENSFVEDDNDMALMEMEAEALELELELLSFVSGLSGTEGVSISRNYRQNGIEVKFRSQPNYDTTSKLKRLGFRYSSRQGLWYAKYTSSLLTRVEELFDVEETASSMPSDLMVNVVQPAPKIDNAARLEEWKRLNQDAIKIASMPLDEFLRVKPVDFFSKATITFDNGKFEMDWNPKKGVFEHLPPKRKRPDAYTRQHVHKLAIRGCLKAGLLVPIEIIQSNPEFMNLSNPYSWVYAKNDLNNLVKEFPIIATDPDYQRIKEFLSEKAHEEEQNGILWDQYRAKALTSWKENKTPVYVHHDGAWRRGKIEFFAREHGGQRKDIVQVHYGSGYITVALTTFIERVYVENPIENPNAKTLLDLFPFEDVIGIRNPYKPAAPKAEPDDFAFMEMEAEALALELELLSFLSGIGDLAGVSIKKARLVDDEQNVILVKSDYNPDFVAKARKLNGRFMTSSKEWMFDARDTERVLEALREVYGEDGSKPNKAELVDVRVFLDNTEMDNSLFMFGRQLLHTWSNKSKVDLGRGVTVDQGSVYSNGSKKHPFVAHTRGASLIVRDVPKFLLSKEKPASFSIVGDDPKPSGAEPDDFAIMEMEAEALALELELLTI